MLFGYGSMIFCMAEKKFPQENLLETKTLRKSCRRVLTGVLDLEKRDDSNSPCLISDKKFTCTKMPA